MAHKQFVSKIEELPRFIVCLQEKRNVRGGPGSGHHGHKGRPGKVGGSLPKLSGLTRPIGQCYYMAGRWMMENAKQIDNARLAHGTATGHGPIESVRFGHAWIEIGAVIAIDAETGRTLLKEQYYRVGKITDVITYTYDEMLKEMLKSGHYGPWHEGAVRSGGWRSYPAPHCGAPGEVGGSKPREECAAGVEKPALFVFDEHHSSLDIPGKTIDQVGAWEGLRKRIGLDAVWDEGATIFILKDGEEPVGVASVSRYERGKHRCYDGTLVEFDAPALELRYLATKRTGPKAYGTRMMLRVVQHALENDCGLCGYIVASARGFYEALGAKVIDQEELFIFVSNEQLRKAVGGRRGALTLDEAADIDWAAWAKLEPADGVFMVMREETREPDKSLLSTKETMQTTVEWWRENMPDRYKGLLDATLREKETDNA